MSSEVEILKLEPAWREYESSLRMLQASTQWTLQSNSDGSAYWSPTVVSAFGRELALSNVHVLRNELLKTESDADLVNDRMATAARLILDGPVFRPGHDALGVTPWEPYGRPSSPILVQLNVADLKTRCNSASDDDLSAIRSELVDAQQSINAWDDVIQEDTAFESSFVVESEMIRRGLLAPARDTPAAVRQRQNMGKSRYWHTRLTAARAEELPQWLQEPGVQRRVEIGGYPTDQMAYLLNIRALDTFAGHAQSALQQERKEAIALHGNAKENLEAHMASPMGHLYRFSLRHSWADRLMRRSKRFPNWDRKLQGLVDEVETTRQLKECGVDTSPAAAALAFADQEFERQLFGRVAIARQRHLVDPRLDPDLDDTDTTNRILYDIGFRLLQMERSGDVTLDDALNGCRQIMQPPVRSAPATVRVQQPPTIGFGPVM